MISNGSMSASRRGTLADVDLDARPRPPPPSPRPEEVSPAAPRSWSATRRPSIEQLEAALQQLRLLEGVADLNGGPLLLALLELGRGEHRGAADPVAARRGAHQHHRVADARGGRAHHPLGRASPTHIALTRQFCS